MTRIRMRKVDLRDINLLLGAEARGKNDIPLTLKLKGQKE